MAYMPSCMMAQGTVRLHCWWWPLPREVSDHHSPCLQATINLKMSEAYHRSSIK